MSVIRNKQGFTLVEILISLVILSIVVLSFLNLFGGSFSNIFLMGQKDRAMTSITDIMDTLYQKTPKGGYPSETDLRGTIEGNFPNEYTNDQFSFLIEEAEPTGDDTQGFKITIEKVYYRDRTVSITSYLRGSD